MTTQPKRHAERKQAKRYADRVMNKMPKAVTSMDREKQFDAWTNAYNGFLAGLRAAQRR